MKRRNHTPERLARYEKLIRRLRQRIFDYPEGKADRVLRRAIGIKVAMDRRLNPPKTDQWGATAQDRSMLGRHGICWGD